MNASITSGQEKQYRRLIEDAITPSADLALKKVPLDNDGLQRLLARGNELQDAITDVVIAKTRELSLSDRYADEEVSARYGYPKEYNGLRPIGEQVAFLATAFGLVPDRALEFAERTLPTLMLPAEAAEWGIGWGAFPSVGSIAVRHFPHITDPAEQNCYAANLVLEMIGNSRKFYNYREGQITPGHYRIHARTAAMWRVIADQQPGDIWIFPFQFGKRDGICRSVRRAVEIFMPTEFGLEVLHTGSQLLIHPERLVRWEQLHIDCVGAEFAPGAVGGFSGAPSFDFYGGEVGFAASRMDIVHDYFGSASGFLAQ